MLEKIFSPELQQLLNSNSTAHQIGNVDKDLSELLVAGLSAMEKRHILWVVGENENLKEKKARLSLWLKLLETEKTPIDFYTTPFEDPYINNEDKTNAIGHKARLALHLLQGERVIIITTLAALNVKIESKKLLQNFFLEIKLEQIVNRDTFIKELMEMGYKARDIVEEKGEISWRGSIVDVFPIDSLHPVRIEIEANTVVSMRIFDQDTQKSLEKIRSIIFSISRFFLNYENSTGYFNGDKSDMNYLTAMLNDHSYRMVISDQKKVIDEFNKLLLHYEKIYEVATDTNKEFNSPSQLFNYAIEKESSISIDETWDEISTPVEWIRLKKTLFELNLEDIRIIDEKVKFEGYRLYILSREPQLSERMAERLPVFTHIQHRIPYSFENQVTKCIFLVDRGFQYVEKISKTSRLKSEGLLNEIQLNDLVVHRKHGIGRFVEFKRLFFENQVNEFLKIEYLNKEFLYVPVYELDVLTKYISFEGYTPGMDRLGGNTWAAKKKRAKKSIVMFARELLELYAMRKAIKGNSYPKDHEMEERLEEGFRYVETEDQKKAINDVLTDLEAEYPMDRLICGDVSFGKTEVALRAALRVAAAGKQVAILCPTTILAYQHFSTFKQRLTPFPITIALISRMVSSKKKKTIYDELAKGKIDIVIGTHALIAREISFKRLGLYIIDEEQRFGVFQKEKLKKTREDIDVLSMSATPIPRTLSLSMAGLHDISNIRTPPLGRVAIKNYVGYYSREIIVSAILNEMERNGSVFIVYNNIERIYSIKEELERWLPSISSVVIHAKMKSEEIENNLLAFIDKQYQVLISTTIIENGIDIPGVNTLIVIDADRFGLTQLYQLRGRIGRGNRQAYAYFLVKSMNISDKAKSRLDAIREFADLGSGYKLAEFDLKLRGAGTLLGNRQHGHIEALGFDYYHQLLVKTIKELKGEMEKEQESKINIHFSYSIDSNYIRNTSERIALYRNILDAETVEQIEEMRLELEDRYGRTPDSIEKIFFAGIIRVMAKKYQLEEVDLYIDKLLLKFPDNHELMNALMTKIPKTEVVSGMQIIDRQERVYSYQFTDYKAFVSTLSQRI